MRGILLAGLVAVGVGLGGCAAGGDVGVAGEELRADCSLVRCALPLCAEGQRLSYAGNACCPQCVDNGPRRARCATVLCAAVVCAEGEELVTSPGDCCGHCAPAHHVAECATDSDCPQYYCIACPCPVSECRGHSCVTWTPDRSTCNSGI
jgi:hypothetical protein